MGKQQEGWAGEGGHATTTVPPGLLLMLVLRALQSGPLHGYAIRQRIQLLTSGILQVKEGSLYPALKRILQKGWAEAEWATSETNRKVHCYRLTSAGRVQLAAEIEDYERTNRAIQRLLRTG